MLPSFQRGRRGFPPVTIIILPWIDEEIEIERFSNESVSSFTEFRLFLNEDLGSGTDSGTWKGSSVTHFGFLLKVGPLFYFNQKKTAPDWWERPRLRTVPTTLTLLSYGGKKNFNPTFLYETFILIAISKRLSGGIGGKLQKKNHSNQSIKC